MPFGGINAESLFNAIDLLSRRNDLEARPFISAWSHEIQEMEHANQEEELIKTIRFERSLFSHLEDEISSADTISDVSIYRRKGNMPEAFTETFIEAVRAISGRTATNVFQGARQALLRMLADVMWRDTTTNVAYLTPLVEAAANSTIVLATLNYDNCIELCAENNGIKINNGIESWLYHENFQVAPSCVNLLKVHGSIDWAVEERQASTLHAAPDVFITPVKFTGIPSEDDFFNRPSVLPGLIFGGQNKLTAKGPFLHLFGQFQASLEQCKQLITIGYSFADEHINAVIGQWLNRHTERKIVIIAGENFQIEDTMMWRSTHEPHLTKRIENLKCKAGQGIKQLFQHK